MANALRRRIHEVLQIPSGPEDKLGRAFDIVITTLIVLNVAAVMAGSMPSLEEDYGTWFFAFELLSLFVFGVEFLLRLWTTVENPEFAKPVSGRARWLLTPFAIVDLLAILPALLFLVDLRFLRSLRLLRLLKLGRYARSTRVLGRVLRERREELLMSLFIVGLGLLITSSFVYYAEREAQPDSFSSIPETLWWGIATITTVGYGDVTPITTAGRVLAGLTAILGVGIIALPVGILAGGFVEALDRERESAEPCPHCGEDVRRPPEEPATARPPSRR